MNDYVVMDRTIEEMKLKSALRSRRIFLNDDVNSDSIFKVCYLIERLVEIDKISGTKEPIEIVIDSYGGYIYEGLKLISLIESLKENNYKIITTSGAISMSMGFMILICSSERRAIKHSRIMCHQPSSGSFGCLQDMEEGVEETKQLWDRMKGLIIKYTSITDAQLEDMKARKYDLYMWSDEALKLNVIDYII